MRNLALVLVIIMAFVSGLFFYGKFPRTERTYDNMQPTELHSVTCISDYGDAQSFLISMPSFEGFTAEDIHDLEESYSQGFCDSVGSDFTFGKDKKQVTNP